ncbi:YqgE/AlgH family protein [Taibaiella koreensis]|uniref:YqgE/AlgH family protein n=1 Tax=Taibaiella koreensis TaxID=1268548 RepID=UPI000E59911C|nr:YqgE/AlgH family protein [Taibaiella koreensis]
MDILDLNRATNIKPAAGKLLIAEPFLTDPGFARTVVLLCEHGDEGSIGFVLNRPSSSSVNDLLPELDNVSLPIFEGGPVRNDTLHLIHRMPELMGGTEVLPGIFWGGSYADLAHTLEHHEPDAERLRLFIGYSGWDKGQLDAELKEGAWLVANSFNDIIFGTETTKMWQDSIRSLGSAFSFLANMPLHPQLN